ncbi:EAL domain-containing protein [Kineococcus terrestris]|uniref:EAL domain-containing protein n=1 Tax=Kineococcus terrestris TaxID=2044856 RepID=UPI0034DB1622
MPDDATWAAALHAVLDDPRLLALHAQPLVELTSGEVAGYELLSRFGAPGGGEPVPFPDAPPDAWFAAADRCGLGAPLQADVVRRAVAARGDLPPETFLTVNVDPHLLVHPEVAGALTDHDDLSRVVVELTEHTSAEGGAAALNRVLDEVRRRGGLVAVDDAGTGYASLGLLLQLRPDVVKLDRELVTGLDADPVKRALVEVLGDLTGRMDAWLLAEGVETEAELAACIALGVPLGQGWALARPAARMLPALPEPTVEFVRGTAARVGLAENVASLLGPAPAGRDEALAEVLLDARDRPVSVRRQGGGWARPTVLAPSTPVADAARRAAARPAADRFTPLVCTDGTGRYLGVVRVDGLLTALARLAG